VFERGLLERVRYDLEPRGFRVEGTTEAGQHRVPGRHSEIPRQLDVAIYHDGADRPFFVADAKWHDRPLDVADVDAFVGLMGDVGATAGLLAAPHGFSDGARRRAAAADVTVVVMSFEEALRYRWMPTAWEIYRWDAASHHDIARAIQAIVDVDLPWSVEDALETVAFEEWDAFFNYMMERRRESAATILECIATSHDDDGWVFNAARILDEHGSLSGPLRRRLLHRGDPDLCGLLGEDDREAEGESGEYPVE
jgi:hypothetical protein